MKINRIKSLERKPCMKTITGERIQLKLMSPDLADKVWNFISRDHAAGGELYSWVKTKEDVEKYITKEVTEATKDFDYFITRDNKVIGTINIHTISYLDHKAEVGYSVEKNEEGQGFVSEGVRLIELEMKRLGFNKLVISCDVENLRSRKVAARNNYNEEGILIQDCIEGGRFRDTVVYGKVLR